jgi:DNA (cytosine-5)-methyltransferase 1
MRVLDLFSGIGGFSLGLHRASEKFQTVAFCEFDKKCQLVLKKHWPDVPIYDDVRKLNGRQFEGQSIELICAGFPCQDISNLNNISKNAKGIDGKQSGLYREILRIAGEVGPKYIVMENVESLIQRGLRRILGELSEIGFDAEWHVISAAAVGGEHKRNRVWIIAYNQSLGIQRVWPEGFKLSHAMGKKELSVRGSDGEWKIMPDVRGKIHGVSGRVDRLKQLGNAVVPQVVEQIGRAIMEVERGIQ